MLLRLFRIGRKGAARNDDTSEGPSSCMNILQIVINNEIDSHVCVQKSRRSLTSTVLIMGWLVGVISDGGVPRQVGPPHTCIPFLLLYSVNIESFCVLFV